MSNKKQIIKKTYNEETIEGNIKSEEEIQSERESEREQRERENKRARKREREGGETTQP